MKKILLIMAIAAIGAVGCEKRPQPLQIDNELTAEQIAQGKLTTEVMWKMSRAGGGSLSSSGTKLVYTQTDYNMEANRGVTTIWIQDMETKTATRLTDTASNNIDPKWSADGSKIYFLSDRSGSMQLWEMSPEGNNARQISSLEKDIEGYGVNAKADRVWYVQRVKSADRSSADVHKDMPKSKARIYDDLMVRHWSYWDMGEYMHLFVGDLSAEGLKVGVDILGSEAAWDVPMAPYFDMSEIAWNNSGDKLAYTCKPLTGTEYAQSTDSDIFVYDTSDGKTQNICKPIRGKVQFNAMVRHEAPMVGYDKYPVWSPDDSKIAFQSQRRAGNEADKVRLFVYNFEGGRMSDITSAFDYNAANVVWDGEQSVLFIAPMQATHQICRAEIPSDPQGAAIVEVLTKGDHDINAFSKSGNRIVAEVTTLSSANEFYDVSTSDGEISQLSQINKPIYDNIKMGKVEKRWVTTTDNKQMLTWVVYPPDFDATKRYPLLLYCQGGPQSVVSQFWSYRWNPQLMAAQGYIVVAPNRRGLPSFGQEWLDQISGDYSGQNIKDYLSAIDNVAAESWADKDRMGCVGASYGGYSVYYLAGHHQGRFKAFISHCGIFNFESMYGHTEELFFINNDYGGPYWDKSNGTAQRSYANSPHKFVEAWDTPLLIITGEKDYRIPYSQSLEAFTAARVRGINSRLVSFEDEAHQIFKPQNSMVWNREFFGWLDRHVKQSEGTNK